MIYQKYKRYTSIYVPSFVEVIISLANIYFIGFKNFNRCNLFLILVLTIRSDYKSKTRYSLKPNEEYSKVLE